MKKLISTVLSALVLGSIAHAQLSGIKTIPGDYPTLAAAITDVNTQGVGPGGVVLNLVAGNPQTAPAGGYVITAQGNAAGRIVFWGNNNTITASTSHVAGSPTDGIFKLVGADYVVIQDFTLQEDPANTNNNPSTNTMTEFGIALLLGSTSNGAQHNSILHNTISLDRSYGSSFAVYSNVWHSANDVASTVSITNNTTAPNCFNEVSNNTISNVNVGILFSGANTAANIDDGTIVSANVITNCGGTNVSTYNQGVYTYQINSIFLLNQKNFTVSGNSIVGAPYSTSLEAFGIYTGQSVTVPGANTNTVTGNTVTISQASDGPLTAIKVSGSTAGSTLNVTNNIVENCQVTGANSSFTGIQTAQSVATLNVTGNTYRGNVISGAGAYANGIYNQGAASVAANINNNKFGDATAGAITFAVQASTASFTAILYSASTTSAALSISSNDFRGITYDVLSSASVTLIYNNAILASQTFSSNTLTNLSLNTTSDFYFILNGRQLSAGGSMTVNANSIVGTFEKTGAGGNVLLYYCSGSTSPSGTSKTITNNNFSNVTVTGNATVYGIAENEGALAGGPVKVISGNVFNNWTCGTSTVTLVQVSRGNTGSTVEGNTISNISGGSTLTAIDLASQSTSGDQQIYNNSITNLTNATVQVRGIATSSANIPLLKIKQNTMTNLSTSGAFGSTGIVVQAAVAVEISGNKIGNLFSSSGTVSGISIGASGTYTVFNNLVGDLRLSSSSSSNAVIGISIAGTSGTADLNSNTVYLNATGVSGTFGSSGISANSGVNVTLRNNLVVNTSTANNPGRTVAYRRSTTSLTTYNSASDNNSFYAGVPSATNFIFYDGTNNDQTPAAYQTRVAPRDANSWAVNPTFASTLATSPVFLHIPPGTGTALESGGVAISGFTTDYDNEARPGPAGSLNGWGTAPDIGADEFDGIRGCAGTPVAGTASVTPTSNCGPTTVTLSLTGYSQDIGYTFQWRSSTTAGGPYANVAGGTTIPFTTGSISTTTYFICVVTCTGSGLSSNSTETAVTINPVPATPTASSNTPACTGNTINLSTATVAGATYAWTGPSSFVSAVQNPTRTSATAAMAGTYSVTVTVGGCTSIAGTTTVVVNTTPTLPVITTNSPVCTGNTINLATAAVAGATYAWTGPSSFSASAQNPSLTNAASAMGGTYSLTVTTSGCTSPTATSVVVVNAPPSTPTATSNSPVCAGNTLNLSTPTQAGVTYSWTGPNSFTASAQNPSLTNATTLMSGTYSVTLTQNGCTSAAGTVAVTVNPLPATPVISSNTPVCTGNTINLSTPAVAGAAYSWSGPASFSSSAQNPVRTNATLAMGGTYSLTVTASGCTSAAGTGTVVVNATPSTPAVSSNSAVCAGNAINLATPAVAGATYAWTGPNSFSASVQNPSLSNAAAVMAGTYSLTITTNGCTSAIGTGAVVVNALPTVIANTTATSVCSGSNVMLNGSGATMYSWSGGVTDFVAFAPTATNTYTVTGIDANGCVDTDVITINVNALPTVIAHATATTVCSGTSVTLSGSGANLYNWSGGVTDNVAFGAMATDTYTVTGMDANGCLDTDVITINVNALPVVVANATATTVCSGTSVTLNGSGATTYSWSGGVTDNVAFVATLTNMYSVTGTDANGCAATDVITINVNALPTVAVNATATTVCFGTSVTLNGSGATTYSWSGGLYDAVPFTAIATDTYTVTGTDANGCTDTDVITVNVNALPAVVANATATTVCFGTSVTLSGSGASNYSWTGGIYNTVPFTAIATDTYTVTGTDANGCQNTDVITIDVNALPAVVANATATTVCSGTSVTLNGSGAATYTWSGGVTDNVAFAATTTGTYIVGGTDANGCESTDTITISVNALPSVTLAFPLDTVCLNGGNVTLGGETPAGGTWNGPGISGSTFDPAAAGAGMIGIAYEYTDGNGCSASAVDSIWVDVCSGIETAPQPAALSIYPNPNTGRFTVQLASAPVAPVQVEVVNGLGQAVQTFTMTSAFAQADISTFESGVYFIRVISGNAVSVQRVVKE